MMGSLELLFHFKKQHIENKNLKRTAPEILIDKKKGAVYFYNQK